MKFALLSDTHGWLPRLDQLEGADVVLHAGDIGPDFHTEKWVMHQWEPWRNAVEHKLDARVLPTFGNHDFPVKWLERQSPVYLDESVWIGGMKIWFSPWSPLLPGWAWTKPEPELMEIYDKIPEDTNVIVSHCPPYQLLDSLAWSRESVGSKSLRVRIGELPHLTHVICGHIHEGRGKEIHMVNGREVNIWNVSCVDEGYKLVNDPITWWEI